MPNQLAEVLPESGKYADVVKLYILKDQKLRIISDLTSQQVICLDV